MDDRSRSRGNAHGYSALRSDSPRNISGTGDERERGNFAGSYRFRSDSADRYAARYLNLPMSETSRAASPTRTISQVLSRDYAERHFSGVPGQSRFGTFGPSSFRRRVGSAHGSVEPSPGPGLAQSWRGHEFYEPSRRSVAIAPTVSGRDHETLSHKFSFAGPAPVETLTANQPYVDPGYIQLNPAYDQPANVRPVWSLAKPLPHVLRSGMVPTRDELEQELEEERQQQEDGEIPEDIEAGRLEPTLRPKVSQQLDIIRRERELSLYKIYRHHGPETPAMSPFGHGRRNSDVPTETTGLAARLEEPIQEEAEEQEHDHEHEYEPEHRHVRSRRTSDMEEFPQLREAISHVHQVKEDEELKVPYVDAMPLPSYQAEDDEVHNLHTYWSLIRLKFREPFAEFLAVMVLDVMGFSANLSFACSRGTMGTPDTLNWAWGLAVMCAIYVAGGVSGAQLNPAMTTMLWVFRGFPVHKIPIFAVAQFLGAFTSTILTFTIFKPGLVMLQQDLILSAQDPTSAITTALNPVSTMSPAWPLRATPELLANWIMFPRKPWVTNTTAFLAEFVGTTILVVFVLALGDDTNAPPGAGMSAFIVGLFVVVVSQALAAPTGLAMNPMRDFAPRVALTALGFNTDNHLWADGYWFKITWVAVFSGCFLGGFIYDVAIFTGGESPVNYPTKRIRRAARKWKKRWRARVRVAKRKVRDVKDDIVAASEFESSSVSA